MTDSRRFFFIHVQKTAGTALWRRLQNHFALDELFPGPDDGPPFDRTLLVSNLVERWPARRDTVRVLAGHFPACTEELLGEDFITLTTLREPVERILSALRDHRQTSPELADTSLEDIYRDPFRHLLLRNHMVKMFSLTTDDMTEGAFSEVTFDRARLERAKERLASVDVVGLQERFEDFCDELTDRFGWDLGPPLFGNRSEAMETPRHLRDLLAEENAHDIELYEFASDLVAARARP